MEDKPPSVNKPGPMKNPRYVRRGPLSLRVAASAELSDGETLEGETYDVSAGGPRFKTELFLGTGTEVEVTLRLSPSFEPVIAARVLRTDTVEDEQGRSFKLVAMQFMGLEPEIEAQIRDTLAPKFSFQVQEGSEESAQRRSGSSGIGTRARDEAGEAGSEEQDRGEQDAEQGDPEAVGWSKVGITELDPNAAETESEEESEEES